MGLGRNDLKQPSCLYSNPKQTNNKPTPPKKKKKKKKKKPNKNKTKQCDSLAFYAILVTNQRDVLNFILLM